MLGAEGVTSTMEKVHLLLSAKVRQNILFGMFGSDVELLSI